MPWGAGGGTDTVARIVATGFEEAMGRPINVVDRAGGSGVIGHSAIARGQPDGSAPGACTSEITDFDAPGPAPITPDGFDLVSRLAVIPAGVPVAADGPRRPLPEPMEAVKAGALAAYTSSGSGLGGPWHMAVAGMLRAAGEPADEVNFIPSQGGALALQELVPGS